MTLTVPDFDDLPKVDGLPQGCAWGIFDRDGEKDVHGTLNFLTPDVVKAAASEVKEGISISLNWPLNGLAKIPVIGRKPPKHTHLSFAEKPVTEGAATVHAWDDELDLNTQSSSQWDSLCHFAHQPTGLSYNGVRATREVLGGGKSGDGSETPAQGGGLKSTTENPLPTLDHWHSRGCIVARAVLLDYQAYAEATGKTYAAFAGARITVGDLEACAAHQSGIEFRPGDVLLVRTGQTEAVDEMSAEELMGEIVKGRLSGVHGAEETARWIWNKRFAAVASDSMAFEAYPPLKPDGTVGGSVDLVLHSYLLACFGMPIGEMWDLKELAEHCRRTKRYTFMLTSAPLNMPGLMGSPPNALAIF